MKRLLLGVLCCLCLTLAAPFAAAQEPAETQAIEKCLTLIRSCQLPDGAFRMSTDGSHVWINPYFANHAALALLAGKKQEDLPRVASWLKWYAQHQLADGTINDWETPAGGGAYIDTGTPDSVDSYAAMYLLVVERYQQVTQGLPSGVAAAAEKAFAAIKLVKDVDGFTWAKPDWHMKYLMDNVEVYGGVIAAERLFTALNKTTLKAEAKQIREVLGGKLPSFWQPSRNLFAWVLDNGGNFSVDPPAGQSARKTRGLANLFALAWISAADKSPWNHVKGTFVPDGGSAAEAPVERWLIAALSTEISADISTYRQLTIQEANGFPATIYLDRAAVTALALLEGYSWLPSIRVGDTTSPAVTLQSPTNSSYIKALTLIKGTASDNTGGTGIARVEVRLRRTLNGVVQYWGQRNGVFGWGSDSQFLKAIVSGSNWSINANLPAGADLGEGAHILRALATDKAGNQTWSSWTTVTVDKTGPTVTITSPASGSTLSVLSAASGTARDSGSGVQKVDLILRRLSDNAMWTGTSWVISTTGLRHPATLSGSTPGDKTWSKNSGWPAGGNLVSGSYRIYAYAYDNVGNYASTAHTFSVQAAASTYEPPISESTVVLSSVAASAATSTLRLTFTGALDAYVAAEIARYVVAVTGDPTDVQDVTLPNASTVDLHLAPGALVIGNSVSVSYDIMDDAGLRVQGNAIVTAK